MTIAPAVLGIAAAPAADQAPRYAAVAQYATAQWDSEPRPAAVGAPALPAPKPVAKPKPKPQAKAAPVKAAARPAAKAAVKAKAPVRAAIRANSTPTKKLKPKPRVVTPPVSTSSSTAAAVLTYTNRERAKLGCGALTWSSSLASAAQGHASDMARNNYFSHTSRDGRNFATRIQQAGYSGRMLAENIAAGQSTPAAVVAGWMASPGHRANIANCAYRHLGVGYATGGSYGRYWVQDFGG